MKYKPDKTSDRINFMRQLCDKCTKDTKFRSGQNNQACLINCRTLIYDVDQKEYPEEWTYVKGEPTCTAFILDPDISNHRHETIKDKEEQLLLWQN